MKTQNLFTYFRPVRIRGLSFLFFILGSNAFADPIVLTPFKDELFANSMVLSQSHGGLFRSYDFEEMRDVNGRDQIPVRRAGDRYVQLIDPIQHRIFDLPVSTSRGTRVLETFEVGKASAARFVVIFIHGGGGNRTLAVNDWTFSGNFNRLKNLTIQNGGTYYSPTIRGFDPERLDEGTEELAALFQHIARVSPGAPIVLACASSGGLICSSVARHEPSARLLGGLVLIGTTSAGVIGSAAQRFQVPVLFAHGSRDSLCPMSSQIGVFEALLRADARYPTIFSAFHTGGHGTPIRMIDWRESLNWIFRARSRP